MLAALSYALASYRVAFATILTSANPLMVERAGLVPMAAGHAVFGVVSGGSTCGCVLQLPVFEPALASLAGRHDVREKEFGE